MKAEQVTLTFVVNFEYDENKTTRKDTITEVANLIQPNFHSISQGVQLTNVTAFDEWGETVREY